MRARDVLRTSIREGTHLTANEYVAILFFDGNVLTVSEIFWTDIIGSSFLSVGGGLSSEDMQVRDSILPGLLCVSSTSESRDTALSRRKVDQAGLTIHPTNTGT